jgi:hypothetical protein
VHHQQQQHKHTFFVIQIFWGFAPAYIFASYLARKPNKLFAALYKHTHTQLVEEKKKKLFWWIEASLLDWPANLRAAEIVFV